MLLHLSVTKSYILRAVLMIHVRQSKLDGTLWTSNSEAKLSVWNSVRAPSHTHTQNQGHQFISECSICIKDTWTMWTCNIYIYIFIWHRPKTCFIFAWSWLYIYIYISIFSFQITTNCFEEMDCLVGQSHAIGDQTCPQRGSCWCWCGNGEENGWQGRQD